VAEDGSRMERAAFSMAGALLRLSPAPWQPGPKARCRRSYGGIWLLWASPAPALLPFSAGRFSSAGAWCRLWALEHGRGPWSALDHLTLVTWADFRATEATPHRRSRCRSGGHPLLGLDILQFDAWDGREVARKDACGCACIPASASHQALAHQRLQKQEVLTELVAGLPQGCLSPRQPSSGSFAL